jgi:hypothetical protein
LAGDEGEPEEINPEHLPDVLESLAQAKRREFATDAEIEIVIPPLRSMTLRFTPRANVNLVEIADYIHARNPAAAQRARAPSMTVAKSDFVSARRPQAGGRGSA